MATIFDIKELGVTYQPLLLSEFTFLTGPKLRVASHPTTWGGNTYDCRVLNYDMAATAALSERGVDYTPTVTVNLSDPDAQMWLRDNSAGFKGAQLKMTFVFRNIADGTFSDDSIVKFVGICGSPQVDTTTLTVQATSLMNMQQAQLPSVRIQKRCPWIFPMTATQRQEAADDESSPFWLCGYSHDATGGNACGNAGFTSCNYSYSDCLVRLGNGSNITKDNANRPTGRFGGVQWNIPNTFWSRSFNTGKWEEVTTTDNEAKMGDYVPMQYGEAWSEPLILTTDGSDGNLTKMHVLMGLGQYTDISRVIVNGTTIPHTFDDVEMSYVAPGVFNTTEAMKSGWWKCINSGDRNGAIAGGIKLSEQPDPYGNLCVIEVVIPKKLGEASSTPRVQVLSKGPKIRTWHDNDPGGGTFDAGTGKWWRKDYTENLAWVLLDVLTWASWRYSSMDMAAWIAYAAVCDANVTFVDPFGASSSHKRYMVSMVLRQRKTIAEIVQGLRNAGKCLLYLSPAGKLTVKHKGTVAAQQPSPIAGSNYNLGVSGGYIAYDFHEGNIAKKKGGDEPSLTIPTDQTGSGGAPNRLTFAYQDRYNRFVPDTLTIVDPEDVARVGQEVAGNFRVEGISNADQGRRCAGTWMAENYRGNGRDSVLFGTVGDTGGTTVFEFDTTFKVIHLQLGDICRLSYQQKQISNQLIRIIKLKPSSDFSRVTVTAIHHNDAWYTDAWFQQDMTTWKPDFRNREVRPSYVWNPYKAQPLASNPLYDANDWKFAIAQDYDLTADGKPTCQLVVSGKVPVNVFSEKAEPPFVGIQGTTSSSGGTLPGGRTYWFMVCAKDVDGNLSAPSRLTSVAVPAGTSTNTVTIKVSGWSAGTSAWVLFGGMGTQRFSWQAEGTGTPGTITLTGWTEAKYGVPDSEFDHLILDLYSVVHAGTWGAEVVSVTSNTVKVGVLPYAGFGVNQFAGTDVTLLGQRGADAENMPVWDARVQSNTADGVLTLVSGSPSPVGVITTFDVVVGRFKPTVGSDSTGNYIEDANMINNLNGLGDFYTLTASSNTTPIEIEVAGEPPWSDGDNVYITGAEGNTATNGLWVVHPSSTPSKWFLGGSAGNGGWTGGGAAAIMGRGMVPDAEAGFMLFFFAGTGFGMWVRVKSNTQTRWYIEGDWPVVPDSSSRFIVVAPTRILQAPQSSVNNNSVDAETQINVDVSNNRGQILLAVCNTVDGGGSSPVETRFREIYIFGKLPSEKLVTSDYIVMREDRLIRADASAGSFTITLRSTQDMSGYDLTILREDSSGNTVTVIPAVGDTVNGSDTFDLNGQGSTLSITATN
jgi:hypothetical protein